MTHEGENGHPIGCDCIECYQGREVDRIGDEIARLKSVLESEMLGEATRAAIETQIRALEAGQDRLTNNTRHL